MKRTSIPWVRLTAEFLAIFAGVTLSLAADDWRQNREERARERGVLAEVAADLTQDSTDLSSLAVYMQRWDRSSQWMNTMVGLPEPPPDSVFARARSLSLISFYQPVASAYRGLRDAGQMYLIESDELRDQIVDYYEIDQTYMLQFFAIAESTWRETWRLLGPHVDFVAPAGGPSMFTIPFLTNGRVTSSWSDLSGDEELMSHIDWAGVIAGNTALRIEPVLAANSELRQAINSALSR